MAGQEFGQGTGFVQALSFVKGDGDLQFGEDAGDGLVAFQGEDGAQAFVTGDNAVEGPFQRGQVQGAAHVQGQGDIVEAAVGIELLQEPEALLGGGQRRCGSSGISFNGQKKRYSRGVISIQ